MLVVRRSLLRRDDIWGGDDKWDETDGADRWNGDRWNDGADGN